MEEKLAVRGAGVECGYIITSHCPLHRNFTVDMLEELAEGLSHLDINELDIGREFDLYLDLI